MRSLWFRLIGGFAAVILVALGVIVVVVSALTAHQFDLFVTRSGQAWTRQIAPLLAASYAQNGDWRDAQTLLSAPWMMRSGAIGPGPGEHMGPMMGRGAGGGNMWGAMGFRMVLADGGGEVVADTDSLLTGQTLAQDVLAQGTPVLLAEGRSIGTLLVVRPEVDAPERQAFLSGVHRAVVTAGVAAGLVALVMGTLLFQRITHPLRDLQRAAHRVASGDLSARVPVTSTDELGEVAEAFNQMGEKLTEQQGLRQQMVADIAHELRNPISVMQATLEAMLDGLIQPSPGEIRELHGDVRRLARLVEDLRTLSLADAGQLALERGPVDVAALAEHTASRVETVAAERGIALQVEADRPLPQIDADEDRLAQVMGNLLDNALRHTPQGGRVTLRVRGADHHLIFEVADDGAGISAEDLPYIFERFWRGDKSRSRQSGGSGLGLAIVRQLVEMHGGTVSAESVEGRGSTFRVSLPTT